MGLFDIFKKETKTNKKESQNQVSKNGSNKPGNQKNNNNNRNRPKQNGGQNSVNRGSNSNKQSNRSQPKQNPNKNSQNDNSRQALGVRSRRGNSPNSNASNTSELSNATTDTNNTQERTSLRLEAKRLQKQEQKKGINKEKIISQVEACLKNDSVDRVMVINQDKDKTQVSLLEDNILAEHYSETAQSRSLIDDIYIGKVINVLPNMEAAFIDIGNNQSGILYAGEINWDLAIQGSESKLIENALKKGDLIMVQVTKNPVNHKGARLSANITLSGKNIVLTQGSQVVSRKIEATRRAQIRDLIQNSDVKRDDVNIIVRPSGQDSNNDSLIREINSLYRTWDDIFAKGKTLNKPGLLYKAANIEIRVLKDILTPKFSSIVVCGDEAFENVKRYILDYIPHMADSLVKWEKKSDILQYYRIDLQLQQALSRIVHLKSGGSIVVDVSEAMTIIDINTGKYTGSNDNLEEITTKTNLEAAEEIAKQIRLRDIGGIIIVDFIDMLFEENRDAVLRRLIEAIARDRSSHSVTEVTKLGLVEITRKRVGQGLQSTYTSVCEHCAGTGRIINQKLFESDFKTKANIQQNINEEDTAKDELELAVKEDTKKVLNTMFTAAERDKQVKGNR